ncbi:uncharacterized protein BYT42DRAFT_579503 [Radiomyces spectabilis]|uniref:uncharacterized protein n=1 Tax=Radiomyces spectabilis TaxID=64574 RepID=UPI0022200A52|nr:uncharacterized protein BYT42DRAFT_579503 [Radiomyces spectabilis]KAI8373183.1 hypothetical protein BYT42DRAFT_579503 [Radiomyces spectabilis]
MSCSAADQPLPHDDSISPSQPKQARSPSIPDGHSPEADDDIYYAMMLSGYLNEQQAPTDNNSDPTQPVDGGSLADPAASADDDFPISRHLVEEVEKDEDDRLDSMDEASPILWVPANKHPEIAPSEFATWIQTHGVATARRASMVRRKNSVLSQSHTSMDDDEHTGAPPDESTTEESSGSVETAESAESEPSSSTTVDNELPQWTISDLKANRSWEKYVFDRYPSCVDNSHGAVPKSKRPLLRRSALSARERDRKGSSNKLVMRGQMRRSKSVRQRHGSVDQTSIASTPHEGITLYDRPVSMREWIDLGSASLQSNDSRNGILSRVQDAESQVYSHFLETNEPTAADQGEEVPPATATGVGEDEEEQDQKEAIPSPIVEQKVIAEPIIDDIQPVSEKAHAEDVEPTSANILDTIDEELSEPTTKESAAPARPGLTGRPSLQRSASEGIVRTMKPEKTNKQDKRSSWFGGFFSDKEKKSRHALRKVDHEKAKRPPMQREDTPIEEPRPALARVESASNVAVASSKKPGFASFISRSLNLKPHSKVLSKIGAHPPSKKLHHTNQPPQPTLPSTPLFLHSYRLPIHVERAIYRLSHVKLADPRRPLLHQVLISNLMFWYLSIIDVQQETQQLTSTNPWREDEDRPPRPSTPKKASKSSSRKSSPSNTSTKHIHFEQPPNSSPSPSETHTAKKGHNRMSRMLSSAKKGSKDLAHKMQSINSAGTPAASFTSTTRPHPPINRHSDSGAVKSSKKQGKHSPGVNNNKERPKTFHGLESVSKDTAHHDTVNDGTRATTPLSDDDMPLSFYQK